MTTWFVTRHPGAIQWAAAAGIQVASSGIVESLDTDQVQAGDTVVGTLPINLAARVAERGAEYLHLALELPLEARGQELSADEMRQYGARLERYDIQRAGAYQTRTDTGTEQSVMMVIASGQTIPNLLPLLALGEKPVHLYVAVSSSGEARMSAKNIKRVAALLEIPVSEYRGTPTAPLAEVQEFARQCFTTIRREKPGARIIVNATGGTKIMSSGFASALGPSGEVIYCDTANDRIEYFSPQGRAARSLPTDLLDLETYLLAQGQRIAARQSDSSDWLEGMQSRKELTRYFVDALSGKNPVKAADDIAAFNGAVYKALRDKFGNSHWNPQIEIYNVSPASLQQVVSSGLLLNGPPEPPGSRSALLELSSKAAAQYLAGGWLEEYCALTMQALSIPRQNWGCGVKIVPIDVPAEKNGDSDGPSLNELDLAVVWRNRLLIVECKTGKQLQGKESQSILNKLEAIRNYAAGSFGTGWLINVRHLEAESPALERAKAYRITLHEREAIAALPQLIELWMGRKLAEDDSQKLSENTSRCLRRARRVSPTTRNQAAAHATGPLPANTAMQEQLASLRSTARK